MWYSPDALDTNVTEATNTGRSPSLAALLSFLWPGLGQLYTGKRRLAAIFAVPALFVLLLVIYELSRGLLEFAVSFVDPSVSGPAAVIVLALGAWRLAAVIHAWLSGVQRSSRRVLDRLVVGALVAVIVISHAGAGYLLAVTYDTGNQVFDLNNTANRLDLTTYPPTANPWQSLVAGATPTTQLPSATPADDGRITMIFTGSDVSPLSGAENRTGSNPRYDSIMVVSFSPHDNSIQMVSIPREFSGYPLFWGGTAKFTSGNEITNLAQNAQSLGSPYKDKTGYTTLVKEVEYLVGVHIDYFTNMNLDEFPVVIDAVGGVDIVNLKDIVSPNLIMLDGTHGFWLTAGPHHLDGKQARAYARDRYTVGLFDRYNHQQEILLALFKAMSKKDAVWWGTNLGTMVGLFKNTIHTNLPADQVAKLVGKGKTAFDAGRVTQVVLKWPTYAMQGKSNWHCPIMPKIAAESIKLFGQDSLWYSQPAPANVCQ